MSNIGDEFNPLAPQHRLELPYGEGEAAAGVNGSPGVRRGSYQYRPIGLNEDDTVLACTHHAHDVARAHGAKEVMLEHLVHALARVGQAVTVLADRGINVDALRRESATVISSDIPVDHTGQAPLRASKDLSTVMYLAAAAACRREERATGVRDVLDALYNYDPKARAVRLVKRHTPGAELDERPDPLIELRGTLDRQAEEMRDLRLSVGDLRNAYQNQYSGANDALQDRMHKLEGLVSSLLSEVRSERVANGDRMQALQRNMGTGTISQLQSMFGDRFLSMQKAVEVQRGDLQRMEQMSAERMKGIEQRIEAALAARGLEMDPSGERLKSVEQSLEVQLGEVAKLETTLIERLQSFERALEAQNAGISRGWTAVGERLAAVERSMTAHKSDIQRAIEGAAALPGGIQIGTGFTDRLQEMELGLAERMKGFEKSLETQLATTTRGWSQLQERLGVLEKSVTEQRNDMNTINKVMDGELDGIQRALTALGTAQATLSTAIEEWRKTNSGDLGVINNQLLTMQQSASVVPRTMVVDQAIAREPRVEARDNGLATTRTTTTMAGTSMLERVVDRALKSRAAGQG